MSSRRQVEKVEKTTETYGAKGVRVAEDARRIRRNLLVPAGPRQNRLSVHYFRRNDREVEVAAAAAAAVAEGEDGAQRGREPLGRFDGKAPRDAGGRTNNPLAEEPAMR